MIFKETPIVMKRKLKSGGMGHGGPNFNKKVSGFSGGGGGGSGGGYTSKRSGSLEKLYKCDYAFYSYPDGSIEIAKNRWDDIKGMVTLDQLIPIFTKLIADLKLKDTELEMFKEGLSELLQEAIETTLKGDYYERAIRAESAGDGS